MPLVTWSRLEVGYEVCLPPRTTPESEVRSRLATLEATLPPMLESLKKAFSADRRLIWLQGGSTVLQTIVDGHRWARDVIEIELNMALPPNGPKFTLLESGLVKSAGPTSEGNVLPDKPDGTRCVLIGDRWFNYRSYRIASEVPNVQLPAHCILMATLWWECEGPKVDLQHILADWIALI